MPKVTANGRSELRRLYHAKAFEARAEQIDNAVQPASDLCETGMAGYILWPLATSESRCRRAACKTNCW